MTCTKGEINPPQGGTQVEPQTACSWMALRLRFSSKEDSWQQHMAHDKGDAGRGLLTLGARLDLVADVVWVSVNSQLLLQLVT